MPLSSLMALGAAILPFAAILALCTFLLSLPSGEAARIINPSVLGVPQQIETPTAPLASAEEPSNPDIPQEPSIEADASLPVVAETVVDSRSDAVSMMATWWAHRERHGDAASKRAALSPRRYRRHRDHMQFPEVSEAPVSQGQLGCPPSVCYK